jgi:hypothetical protein
MKITKRQLRRIIKEYKELLAKDHVDGHPWSGTLEDLATVQGKTWGGGSVVDPKGYKNLVGVGMKYTKGTVKKMFEHQLAEVSYQLWANYSPEAIEAADAALQTLNPSGETMDRPPVGGEVESEIHYYLENTLGMDRTSDEIFKVGDEALEVVEVMLGMKKGSL